MFEDVDPRIRPFVNDYKIHLICPKDIDDFTVFKTELGIALQYIAVSGDRERLMKTVQEPQFRSISNGTVMLLNACTHSNIKINEKMEETDMCKAIEEMKRIAAEEATASATAKTSAERIILATENAMKVLGASIETACKVVGNTPEEYYEAKKLLEELGKKPA